MTKASERYALFKGDERVSDRTHRRFIDAAAEANGCGLEAAVFRTFDANGRREYRLNYITPGYSIRKVTSD